jgi:branched-chain amino acid transport system permease protein
MSEHDTSTPAPQPPEDAPFAAGPAVGQDEWVARFGEHRLVRGGRIGVVEQRLRAVPWWAWLTLFVALVALIPVGWESGYVRRVAFDTVLFMLLALGLNIVVGWGGLLDLGYVAFYGVGAYTYAILGSEQFDIHVPTIALIPLCVVIGAVVGFLLGLPSWRLVGDYLAIVTLFFLQIFQTVMTNGDQLFGHNVTGGANGILNVDPLSFFGHELPPLLEGKFNIGYLYVALGIFAVVYVALRFVNESRTGRAWRSLREDPLAAEVMGMPVNWLKLMSFAFGAAVAALTGTLFAALNSSAFPQTFGPTLLIIVYAMVILGGQASQPGVVIGAILISVLQELLRDPSNATRTLFYIVIGIGILGVFRVSAKLAVAAAGIVGVGFAAHAIAQSIDGSWVEGSAGGWTSDWVIIPQHLAGWVAPVSYVSLIALVLALTLLRGWWRVGLLVPVVYLGAFVWENVMIVDVSAGASTRYIVLGAILVGLMIIRPNGLLGERRVEII